MSDDVAYWQKKIGQYVTEDWSSFPSIFAEYVATKIPLKGKLLELGCGYGNDGIFFAQQGLDVLQTDIADFRSDLAKNLPWQKMDMSKPLSFESASFDIVYAHLSIHYFTKKRTKQLIREISKTLKPGGYFAFLVNSDQDPESNDGHKIEDGLFELNGITKRFFTISYTQELTEEYFESTLLNNEGTSYKDQAKGVHNLIQYIGRKK